MLLVIATEAEGAPVVQALGLADTRGPLSTWGQPSTWGPALAGPGSASPRTEIRCLITGVGMVATATWVSRVLASERVDVAINLGVCGSFDPTLTPGTVVHVISDALPELGAEDGEAFLPASAIGLLDPEAPPFTGGRLLNLEPPRGPSLDALPRVSGITVNTVHGHEPSIDAVRTRLAPQVESMEGAAFMYACLVHGVPFAQIRVVSNMVERRNRGAWRLADAIAALGPVARAVVSDL